MATPEQEARRKEREESRIKRKEENRGSGFTGSDMISAATTLTGIGASFGEGLKYDPNADKPAIYNPTVSAPVGDPNYDRYINDIERNTSTTQRKSREFAGSDTNKGILGILEADRQGLEAKSRVNARHSDMLIQQRQREEDIRNEAKRAEVAGENRFRERSQDRDVRGSERAQDAAKGAIESGAQYFADKDANERNARVLERQANDRLDIVRRQERTNFDANYLPTLGVEATEALWESRKEERDKFYEGKYGNVYGTRDAYLAEQEKLKEPIAPVVPPVVPPVVDTKGSAAGVTNPQFIEKPELTDATRKYAPLKGFMKFFDSRDENIRGLPKAAAADENYPEQWTREEFERRKGTMADLEAVQAIEDSLVKRGL